MRFCLLNIGILSGAHFGVALLVAALETRPAVIVDAFLFPSVVFAPDGKGLWNGLMVVGSNSLLFGFLFPVLVRKGTLVWFGAGLLLSGGLLCLADVMNMSPGGACGWCGDPSMHGMSYSWRRFAHGDFGVLVACLGLLCFLWTACRWLFDWRLAERSPRPGAPSAEELTSPLH